MSLINTNKEGEYSRAYYSFSQDFNDLIEQKKNLESIYEDPIAEEEEEKFQL